MGGDTKSRASARTVEPQFGMTDDEIDTRIAYELKQEMAKVAGLDSYDDVVKGLDKTDKSDEAKQKRRNLRHILYDKFGDTDPRGILNNEKNEWNYYNQLHKHANEIYQEHAKSFRPISGGTEKQIAYATSIRRAIISSEAEAQAYVRYATKSYREANSKLLKKFAPLFSKIRGMTSAKEIIDNYKQYSNGFYWNDYFPM